MLQKEYEKINIHIEFLSHAKNPEYDKLIISHRC